jgi:hypothetical protein
MTSGSETKRALFAERPFGTESVAIWYKRRAKNRRDERIRTSDPLASSPLLAFSQPTSTVFGLSLTAFWGPAKAQSGVRPFTEGSPPVQVLARTNFLRSTAARHPNRAEDSARVRDGAHRAVLHESSRRVRPSGGAYT